MGRRKFPSSWKALMHFDYPYYAEPGDGCRDEIGSETWTRAGSVKFVGAEAPNDAIVADTPKFDSYRCPQFASSADYISGTNTTGIFNLSSDAKYEIECFVRPTSASAGNIFALRNASGELLTLALDANRRVVLTCTAWGANTTGAGSLVLITWSHILLRISGGTATVYADGVQYLTASLTASVSLSVTEVRLGGFVGQMDEFLFKGATGTDAPSVPTEPYQGSLNINAIGGYGNGAFGDETISTQDVQINTYAMIQNVSGSKVITVGARSNGRYGDFSVGDEIMIHLSQKKGNDEDELGKYAIRRISAISGSIITLDRELDAVVDGFSLNTEIAVNYYAQVVSIPNYQNLTVLENAYIAPLPWNAAHGGSIVALKCSNSLQVNGGIITLRGHAMYGYKDTFNELVVRDTTHTANGAGPKRTDSKRLTHSSVIDEFVLLSGGNIFIAAKNVAASDTGRIGWCKDGSGKGGYGGLGYGGGYVGNPAKGVGLGGDGTNDAGGEFARGGAYSYAGQTYPSGPSLILIADRLSASMKAISTGGPGSPHWGNTSKINENPGGGSGYGGGGGGGGPTRQQKASGSGAGPCYIACRTMTE